MTMPLAHSLGETAISQLCETDSLTNFNLKAFECLQSLYESGAELIEFAEYLKTKFNLSHEDAVSVVGEWINKDHVRIAIGADRD